MNPDEFDGFLSRYLVHFSWQTWLRDIFRLLASSSTKLGFADIVLYNLDGFFHQLLVKGVMVIRLGSIFNV